MGIISAVKRNGFLDNFVRVIGLIGLFVPILLGGAILIVLVSGAFDNFNLFGYVSPVSIRFLIIQVMFLLHLQWA